MQTLLSQLGTGAVGQISDQLGMDQRQTQQVIGMALPMILGALNRNTSSARGAKALTGALKRDHDGSILDNLPQALMAPETIDDGTKILGHVLGDRSSNVVNSVSRATKTDSDQVLKTFALLAPVVLGAIGQVQRQKKLNARGVSTLLSQERQTVENTTSGLSQLLDFDGDGDVSEEIVTLGSNLLGGLFGGK
jgi:hypothetical protein